MYLIGMSGKKKSGKDTVFNLIKELYPTKYIVRIGFADALKEEICRAIVCVGGRAISLDYIEKHKDNFRLIMQGWGTDFRRILTSPDYWINKVIEKLTKLDSSVFMVVIPDVRFLNEAQFITKVGGYLIDVKRYQSSITADNHPSESEMDSINFDYTIYNNDPIKELKLNVQKIMINIFSSNKMRSSIKESRINV